MMISPGSYSDEHKNDTFNQLMEERDSLYKEIKELEKIVYNDDRGQSEWKMQPGPDVIYQMDLEYLAEICNLLQEKYNSEIIWGDSEKE